MAVVVVAEEEIEEEDIEMIEEDIEMIEALVVEIEIMVMIVEEEEIVGEEKKDLEIDMMIAVEETIVVSAVFSFYRWGQNGSRCHLGILPPTKLLHFCRGVV